MLHEKQIDLSPLTGKGSGGRSAGLFAWRYFRARKTTNAINIIAWISIVAIGIGTTALILVLSVFNGFEDLVKSLYSTFYPQLKITAVSGKQVTLTQAQLAQLRTVKGVHSISLVAEEKAWLQNKAYEDDSTDYQSLIVLKGVDENYTTVNDVNSHIVEGAFKTGTKDQPLLVLGIGVANAVAVQTDRNIRPLAVYTARRGEVSTADPLQLLSSEAVNTSGAFIIQQDFDNKYVLTNLAFVKRMLNMGPDAYSAAEISLTEGDKEEADIQQSLQRLLGNNYLIQNRFEQNRSLYSIMRIEKWIIYAILSLILVVAAFNMIGALTMLVLEKKPDINVLHALGATRRYIQKIFLNEGLLLAAIGGGTGMLLALAVCLLQQHFHFIPLQGSSFMINYFPVKIILSDFILVGTTVVFIAVVASWLPARKAARQQMIVREE